MQGESDDASFKKIAESMKKSRGVCWSGLVCVCVCAVRARACDCLWYHFHSLYLSGSLKKF